MSSASFVNLSLHDINGGTLMRSQQLLALCFCLFDAFYMLAHMILELYEYIC
jgi:hypothetical protein